MAECKKCGKSYNVLTADLGSGLCPECRRSASEAVHASASTKPGGGARRVVVNVFAIMDALAVLYFVFKAGEVASSASRMVSENASSAMQASQIYNEATVALLYYICVILALLLGQVWALAIRFRAR